MAKSKSNNKINNFLSNPIKSVRTYLDHVEKTSEHKFVEVDLRSDILKYSKLYKTSKRKTYLFVCLLGVIASLVTLFLFQNSGVYSSGVSGVFQGIARMIRSGLLVQNNLSVGTIDTIYNVFFWITYFLVNIPLCIFAYKKISKKFAILTILYIAVNQISGLLFNLIPGIGALDLLGNTSGNNINVNYLEWDDTGSRPFNLFIYTIIGAALIGWIYSILYILGTSTGGSDVISFYYAKVKNRNIAKTLVIVNVICTLSSALLGTFGAMCIQHQDQVFKSTSAVFSAILSPNLVFSSLSAIIMGMVINNYFPRSKFITIKVYSTKTLEIRQKFIDSGYNHGFTIYNITNGYTLSQGHCLETTCMFIEIATVINIIRSIDNNAIVKVIPLTAVDGKMNMVK